MKEVQPDKTKELPKQYDERRQIKSLTVIHGHVAPGVLKSNDSISEANHKGVEMYLDKGFIEVTYEGKVAGIPLANIKGWVFE